MRKSTISRITVAAAMLLVVAAALAVPRRGASHRPGTPKGQGRAVDLVIALDTSGSMDGLIDSARQKLWDVVGMLSKAQPQPVLRVGLVSYGNDGYPAASGWVRQDSDLTSDLDTLYAKLFALRTNCGQEYVARAVHDATTEMSWSRDPDALRMIFVAGNEPATQDPLIPLDRAVQEARARGIFVNAIYCGSESAGEAVGWRQVATLGNGQFAAIDQNHVLAITTPMDGELSRLSAALNQTYVAYGETGRMGLLNQAAQDKNAASAGPAASASRAAAKAGGLYRADAWDLVDARAHGRDLGGLKDADLPEPLRALSPAERAAYLDGKAKERTALQKQIAELNAKRERFVETARKKQPGGGSALDDALDGSIRREAESRGFKF